jgi:hypothetical protein
LRAGLAPSTGVEGGVRPVKRRYERFPKKPLEWKISEYVRLLDEGWGRNYSRAKAGLRIGRYDYEQALLDERVVGAHLRNREAYRAKRSRW